MLDMWKDFIKSVESMINLEHSLIITNSSDMTLKFNRLNENKSKDKFQYIVNLTR